MNQQRRVTGILMVRRRSPILLMLLSLVAVACIMAAALGVRTVYHRAANPAATAAAAGAAPTAGIAVSAITVRTRVAASPDSSISLDPDDAPSNRRQVIKLVPPKEIVAQLAPMSGDFAFAQGSVELMPSRTGTTVFREGMFGFHASVTNPLGTSTGGYRFDVHELSNVAVNQHTRELEGFFSLTLIPGGNFRVDFDAVITVRPAPDGGTGIDAVEALVNWRGPIRVDGDAAGGIAGPATTRSASDATRPAGEHPPAK